MRHLLLITTALPASFCLAMPAAAQGQSAQQELADLRAQVQVLVSRIDQLEGEVEALENNTAPQADDSGTTISWNGAPEIEGEGGWSFKPRGRLQFDTGFVSGPDGADLDTGMESELRRARLGVEGDIPGGFGYKFEVDFAGNEVELADGIITYKDDGLTVSIGHHNNFQSMEELTSSRFITNLERAAFTDAFGFERRVGVSVQYTGSDHIVQAGLFSDNVSDLPGDSWSADGRAVYFPKSGDTQFHVGGSVHYTGMPMGSTVRYRQRPFVHFTGDRPVNTGSFSADSEFGVGAELAAINGPFHAAGEAYWQSVDRPMGFVDPTFFGGYAELGVYLTDGDSRGYKRGVFDRTRPQSPVGEGGFGALEFNVRFDHLDLNDSSAGIIGGTQNAYAAALVWTPTDYTRFILNYAHVQYDNAAITASGGDANYGVDTVGLRAQVDF